MADNFYTSLGGLHRDAFMLSKESTGPNVAPIAHVLHPDDDGIYQILDTDNKASDLVTLMGAFVGEGGILLGPHSTRAAAVAAQEPE